jgi:hypothetical protein
MAFIRFQFETVAQIARMAMMMTTVNASSSSPVLGQKSIEDASKQNKWLFALYMVCVVGAAILTYLLWQSGNKVQGTIVADADARIAEANSTAAQAVERTTALEHDNLTLRTDLNTETGKVAGLQKGAADAKAAQQEVQIKLATQQEKAAIAEKALADLKKAIQPRNLTADQITELVRLLSGEPKGTVSITCVMGDGEGNAFATQIDGALKAAGWPGNGVSQAAFSGGDPTGFGILVHSAATAPPYAGRLQRVFFSIGIPLAGVELPSAAEGTVQIIVGHKPSPKL